MTFANLWCYSSGMAKKKAGGSPGEESFGAMVKRARKERGITQKDLAERCGIHEITLVKIETGVHEPQPENRRVILETLQKIPKLPQL